jgi:hypothetical protein
LDFGFWIGQGVQGFFKIEKTVILFHVSFGNAIVVINVSHYDPPRHCNNQSEKLAKER